VKLGLSSATEGNVHETKNILLRIIIVSKKEEVERSWGLG
jgi:hypothetical protein